MVGLDPAGKVRKSNPHKQVGGLTLAWLYTPLKHFTSYIYAVYSVGTLHFLHISTSYLISFGLQLVEVNNSSSTTVPFI